MPLKTNLIRITVGGAVDTLPIPLVELIVTQPQRSTIPFAVQSYSMHASIVLPSTPPDSTDTASTSSEQSVCKGKGAHTDESLFALRPSSMTSPTPVNLPLTFHGEAVETRALKGPGGSFFHGQVKAGTLIKHGWGSKRWGTTVEQAGDVYEGQCARCRGCRCFLDM